jgi:plastocyanin
VIVVPNCTGVDGDAIGASITTSGITFSPTTATITAGQYVKFTTSGDHNFQNQPGAAAASTFVSAAPGSQTTCLQFTVAGSFPFECVVHAGMGMTGTLTVN